MTATPSRSQPSQTSGRQVIDSVLSDIGNVPFLFDNDRAARAFADRSLLPNIHDRSTGEAARIARVNELLFEGVGRKFFNAFMRGDIDGEMYAAWIMNYLRLDPGVKPAQVREMFADVITPNGPAIAGLESLRAQRVRLVAGSNMDPWRRARLRELGLDQLFDHLCFSYDLRALKPERDFYLRATAEGKLIPGRTLFIDDKQRNVDAAISCGLHGEIYDHRCHVQFLRRVAQRYRFVRAS